MKLKALMFLKEYFSDNFLVAEEEEELVLVMTVDAYTPEDMIAIIKIDNTIFLRVRMVVTKIVESTYLS